MSAPLPNRLKPIFLAAIARVSVLGVTPHSQFATLPTGSKLSRRTCVCLATPERLLKAPTAAAWLQLNFPAIRSYDHGMRTAMIIGCALLTLAAGPAPPPAPTRAECLAQDPMDDLRSLPIGSTLSRHDVVRIRSLQAC